VYRHEIHFPLIRSFRHRGLQLFFETGSKAGIQPKHANRLRLQLSRLDAARGPEDMDIGGWRLTFRFSGTDVEVVDYLDYH
jgi:proteic killer suppression protein